MSSEKGVWLQRLNSSAAGPVSHRTVAHESVAGQI